MQRNLLNTTFRCYNQSAALNRHEKTTFRLPSLGCTNKPSNGSVFLSIESKRVQRN